jgi:PKD repeat protein
MIRQTESRQARGFTKPVDPSPASDRRAPVWRALGLLAFGWLGAVSGGGALAATSTIGGADGSFETGLTGTVTAGVVRLVPRVGVLTPTQGVQALLMTTEPDSGSQPADANQASLRIENFAIPAGTGSLRLDYSFLTDETVPSRTNDRFTVTLVLISAGGQETLLAQDTFDSFYPAPWTGYTQQTGLRKLVADVSAHAGTTGRFTLELRVKDTGDGRADSAVFVDNLLFANAGEPVAKVATPYLHVPLGQEVGLDGSGSSDNGSITEYRWDLGNGWSGIGPIIPYTYTEEGVHRARLQVKDDAGNTSTQDVTIIVGDLNHGPTIVTAPVTAAAQNVAYRYQVRADDPELVYGDVLSYALVAGPASMTIDPASGLIAWVPTETDPRKSAVTVRVTDSEGLFTTQNFSVTIGPESYVIATQDNGWVYYSRSFGDGTWTPPKLIDDLGENTRGVAIADFDGDGDFDFVSGHYISSTVLGLDYYERQGNLFQPPVTIGTIGDSAFSAGSWLEDLAAEDFDNDGAMDFAVNGDSAHTWVFMNRGRLQFEATRLLRTDFEDGAADGWASAVGGTTVSVDAGTSNPVSGSTKSLRIAATVNNNRLSARLNASGWDLAAGPTLRFAYKVPAGVPVGVYVYVNGKGWLYLGGSPTAIPDASTPNDVIDLIADGTWRTLELDLYHAVKDIWADARGPITQVLFWTKDNAQNGQAFWIDDFETVGRQYISGFEMRRLPSTGGNGRGMDAGDVNGDGDQDLVRARYSDGLIYLYTNDGKANFTPSSAGVADPGNDPYGVLMADFDNDAATDIIANYASNGDSSFFKGNRSGSFLSGIAIPSLDTGTYASFGAYDFNNDGNQDVVAANYTSRQMLYYPGNGNATFASPVVIGNTASNALAIAAPAGRVIGQPFAAVQADTEAIAVDGTVNFDASASFDDGVIAEYRWDFGDGTTATGVAPSHTYTREGDFTVIVTAVDNEAKIDRRPIHVKVTGAPPVAVAGDYALEEGSALNGKWHGFLNGGGSTDDSVIVLYEWDLDASDGLDPQPMGQTPSVSYTAPGHYTVTLRVTDSVGQTATGTGTVTVSAAGQPRAALTGPGALDETAASQGDWTGWYDAAGSSDDLSIAAYTVAWGDGTTFSIAPLADDFDDGNFTGWTVNGGSWSVVNGVVQQSDLGENWRWLQDLTRSYRDFMLEVDFRGIEGPSDGYVGIAFRNANGAGSTDSFLLYSRASWNLWSFYDWSTNTTLGQGGSGWDFNTWYHLKLVVVGDRVRLWVTPQGQPESVNPILDMSNAAHPRGGIGLLSWGQQTYFDNVKVTPLDANWTWSGAGLHDLAHTFGTVGEYGIGLTTTDHAGQQALFTLPVSVSSGAAPVASAGGPYVLGERDAWDGRWDFIANFTASTDDTAIERFRIDFGDGTSYTTSAASGAATGYFMTGTDLYGYAVPNATLQRIIATEDGTKVDLVNLATMQIIASTTLNRLQSWNGVSPGDGVFFKVKASKPVVAYLTNLANHSAFMPSLDGQPVGKEFVIHRDVNQGFYVFAYEDARVSFYATNGTLAAERYVHAGTYWSTGSPLGDTTYRVLSTGRIAMQTDGANGYTTVPSDNGSPVGRLFYGATYTHSTAAFAVFAYDLPANVQVYDLDSGALLYNKLLTEEMWYQNEVGTRRIRVVSDADMELWAGGTEYSTGIVDLGDDISETTGRNGTEFVLHELRDGIVIFSPNEGTTIDIDGGLLNRTLHRDGYLLLTPSDLQPLDVHRITASKPVVIQTLGRANAFNDLGTYLGGVSARNWYKAPGTYTLSLTAIDRAGQESAPATTTVQVTQGDPPVPVIVAPPEAGEAVAHGGRWPVHFDATASTDDSEIIRYEWTFGDGDSATGAVVDHDYDAVGEYEVTLTTTDRAGQRTSTTWTVNVTQGSPPVADTGGPYTFGEESASYGVWTAPIDATGSTDDAAIYDYLWTLDPITLGGLGGAEIDSAIWQYQNVTVSGGVATVSPTSSWGSTYLVTNQAYRRGPGTRFTAVIRSNNTGENLMWGLKNLGANASYTQFPYAIYFAGGTFHIYENGTSRGSFGSYNRNQDYEVRIDLKQPAGAIYYVRVLGAADWTKLYESSNASDPYLRVGLTGYSGIFQASRFVVQQTDERPITSLSFKQPGVYNLTLRVRDNALQEGIETTTLTISDGAAPVAKAGGSYQTEVGSMLTLNGSASTDDVAIQSFDWVFGDSTVGPAVLPYTGKGARTQHVYREEGTYTAELTVTDNTGKRATDTAEVTVVTGAAPVADAGGPYVGGVNGPPVYFDGTASTDDFGIVEYRWDLDSSVDRDGDGNPTNDIDAVGPRPIYSYPYATGLVGLLDDFQAAQINSGLWTVARAVQQNGVLTVSGTNSWASGYAFAVPIKRDGQSIQGRFRVPAGQGENAMWGVKNTSTDFSYTQMPHAIYLANGRFNVYEGGSYRGQFQTYSEGVWYDLRIDLKGTGATYYYRQTGAAGWTQMYDSAYSSEAALRIGMSLNSGSVEFDDVTIIGGSADPILTTLTVEDGAGQTATATVPVSVAVNLAPDVITVPWVAGDLLTPHETYNGKQIHLKGIVRDGNPTEFEWDFGDGTKSGRLPVTNPYDLSVTHTYPDSPDKTPFTATLTVWDSAGLSGQDLYRVIVKRKNLTVEINVAIDEGLWFLHQRQTRTTSDGYPSGWWQTTTYAGYYASPTASALQAFEINGHFEHGDNSTNPYAETVGRGLKYLFTQVNKNTITAQTYGEPDTNGNGIGITVSSGRPIYEGGPVMDAIASSRTPLARTVTGSDQIKRRSYYDILTDMADQYAWGQYDNASVGGGWRYNWNEHPDNSAAQWGAIGLQAAEETFGIPLPPWVKERNNLWLNYSHDGTGFGYSGAGNGPATTPSGMVQLAFDDKLMDDPRWQMAEAYIAGQWSRTDTDSVIYEWSCSVPNAGTETCRDYYSMYALTKAMRLALPSQVVTFQSTGLDWFDDPENGIARVLIGDQLATGRFQGANWTSWDMRSAWAVIMLSRTLFVERPVADAGDGGVWAVNVPYTFDGSNSYHPDPFRSIVRYEWDFDGDGAFDYSSSEPTAQHTFADPVDQLPKTYTATLRVTDNNIPSMTATDTVQLTLSIPPRPPIADAGGPYVCTQGVPCRLDGSRSHDLDEPFDQITTYGWELDFAEFPRDFNDAVGAQPTYIFSALGSFDVGLTVWDNGFLNDLNGDGVADADERKTGQDFSRVRVVQNGPPGASVNGPFTINEGDQVTVDGSGSSDPNGDGLTLLWDLNGDGIYDDGTGPTVSFTGADNGLYRISLKATDSVLEGTAGTTVTVSNVAPAVNAGADQGVVEGGTFSGLGGFTDPGADTWGATVDYGDGSGVRPLVLNADKSFALSHAFTANGSYTVKVTVTDDDGGVGLDTLRVIVTDGAPTARLSGDASRTEGQTGAYDASASTSSPDAIAGYEWDWGYDGSFDPSGDTGAAASHTWVQNGTATVAVRVTDSDGSAAIATLQVTVANLAPVVAAGPDQSAGTGQTVALAPATFSDAGIADRHSAGIDWGDGSPVQTGIVSEANGSGSVAGSHGYAVPGSYTVTITVTDDAGGSGQDSLQVQVTAGNLAPIADPGGPYSVAEGTPLTLDGSGSRDPDSAPSPLSYAWDLDQDGAYDDATGATVNFPTADDRQLSVGLRVSDGVLANSAATTVTVSNVAPVVEAGSNQTTDLGQSVALTPATFSDAGTGDTHGAIIDWGDGTVAAGTVSEANGSGSVAGSHAYAAAGTYTVTVTLTDDDGGIGSDSLTVQVQATAPEQTIFDLSAAVKSGKVGLSWHSVVGVSSYTIYRATVAGGPYDRLATGHRCAANPCVYLDGAITNGRTYYYVVTSVNGGVESLRSNEVRSTPTVRR